ncbi:hypothetical protein SDC9_60454 [bioreactor metagenome]|jgi:hypothetical protein|uniref:Uncharacterized protein n=1 Tax=bioreactor metagenome TaxID=1076179 RepID=A0A644XJ30_9ZZZZ
MANIILDPKAREHIMKNGGTVTIERVKSGCG